MRPVSRHALHTPLPLLQILMLGGTRFIGVYLARMLVDAGHDVTLLTRGKKPVTFRIPDDTGVCAAAWPGVQAGLLWWQGQRWSSACLALLLLLQLCWPVAIAWEADGRWPAHPNHHASMCTCR